MDRNKVITIAFLVSKHIPRELVEIIIDYYHYIYNESFNSIFYHGYKICGCTEEFCYLYKTNDNIITLYRSMDLHKLEKIMYFDAINSIIFGIVEFRNIVFIIESWGIRVINSKNCKLFRLPDKYIKTPRYGCVLLNNEIIWCYNSIRNKYVSINCLSLIKNEISINKYNNIPLDIFPESWLKHIQPNLFKDDATTISFKNYICIPNYLYGNIFYRSQFEFKHKHISI